MSDQETYSIIGAAMTVHKELGHGFLEPVYQEALALEFSVLDIPFQREVELPVHYRRQELKVSYRADFICYDSVIVELKALSNLTTKEESQVINYLKATGFERGLLINFGASSLQQKRLIFSKNNLRTSAKSADETEGNIRR